MGGGIRRLIIKLLIFEPIAIFVASISIFERGTSLYGALWTIGRHVVFYPYGALWYVNALIMAIVLLIPAIKYGKESYAFIIGVLLYFFFLLFNRYNFLVAETPFQSTVEWTLNTIISMRNGVFVGLIFVSLGILIAKKLYFFQKYYMRFSIMAAIAYMLLICETYLIRNYSGIDDNGFYISFIAVIPTLFITLMFLPNPQINTKTFRNLSTSIYFMHKPILGILAFYGLSNNFDFLLTLTIIFSFCFYIYRMKLNPIYGWII